MSSCGIDYNQRTMKRRKTKNDSTSGSRQWANLNEDILLEISKRDDSPWPSNLRGRLRSVCTSWRTALSAPPLRGQLRFPIKVPYKYTTEVEGDYYVYVKESTYYLMSHLCTKTSSSDSKQGWIIRVNEAAKPRTWHLLNPIKDNSVLSLSERGLFFKSTPPIRAEINLLDYQFRELTRSYTLVDCRGAQVSGRVAVLLSPIDAYGREFTAIVAFILDNQLAFWKTGETKKRFWSKPNDIARITSHKGKIYAAEKTGNVYEIDPKDTTSFTTVASSPRILKYDASVYFVEGQGCLYYIVNQCQCHRSSHCCVSIFVLNEEHCRWDSVTSIKDQVFFLLPEASFALPTRYLGRDSRGGWICFENGRGSSSKIFYPSPSSCCKELQILKVAYAMNDESLCMCEFRELDEGGPLNRPLPRKMIPFKDSPYKDYTSIFSPLKECVIRSSSQRKK